MTSRRMLIPLALLLCGTTAAAAQDVENTSYHLPNGERVLQHEMLIPAPIGEVWRAWSTTDGLSSFVAPLVAIDLRIGGIWEASYDPSARLGDPGNIMNEVLSFIPERMLSVRIHQTPPGFPHPELAKQLWTVIELVPSSESSTTATVSMLGWGDGEGWDTLYDLFNRGNHFTLQQLYRRFAEGPIEWSR
jgi:uncharacterized protein YndB with AHSA1/START domain